MKTRRAQLGLAMLAALTLACASSHGNGGATAGASGQSAAAGSGSADAGTDAGATAGASGQSAAAGSGGADAGTDAGATADGGPSSTCTQAWFKCRDTCPSKLLLRGGGRSFGQCQGECSFDLVFGASVVLDNGACDGLVGTLDVHSTSGAGRRVNFELTDAAWEEATRLSLALRDARLAAVTGCPDCADAGAAWITTGIGGADPAQAKYEYGHAPDALLAADAFLQALIDQARTCQGEFLASCHTWDNQTDSPIGPSCGTEPLSTVRCGCTVDLHAINGTACDGSCGMCSFQGTCGAHCISPCAGGGPVWSTWCTE